MPGKKPVLDLPRSPDAEMQAMLDLVANNQAPAIYEDIFAGLFTTSDFLFNH